MFFSENDRSRDDQLITSGISKVMVETLAYKKMNYKDESKFEFMSGHAPPFQPLLS